MPSIKSGISRCSLVVWLGFLCSTAFASNELSSYDGSTVSTGTYTRPNLGLLDNGSGVVKAVELSEDKIALTGGLKKRPFPHVKASVLTVALFGLFGRKERFVWFSMAVLLYILETSTCSTRRYLSNSYTPAQLRDHLNALQETPLSIVWTVECYHYRTSHVGKSRHRQKVVTHRAVQKFIFESSKDVTDTYTLERSLYFGGGGGGSSSSSATFVKTTLSKLALFANEKSIENYRAQEESFKLLAACRDRYTDFSTHLHVDGFRHKILAVRTGLSDVPMAQTLWFWFFSLLGMTVPYRIWFARHCDEVEITLTKTITA